MNYRKNSFTLLSLVLVLAISFGIGLGILVLKVKADSAGTSVTVGNVVPAFTVNPHEDPASTTASPTDAGTDVTFKGTATDKNSDNWTLLLCKTAGVTVIDCDGGAGDRWCVSSSTTSGSEANCTYTALVGDGETNAWWGYACDATGCSAFSQGTGDPGTPFYVNHGASFTVVGDAPDPCNPGNTVTITTTADDPDIAGGDDTLDIFVCKTAGATSSGCDGGASDTWCKDDTTNSLTNPTCNWTMDINATNVVTSGQCEGAYSYWTYIYDNHGLAATATGGKQGTEYTNTVSNVAPVTSSVSLNGGTNITLTTESSTTNINVTGTVTDNNGCGDVDSGASDSYSDTWRTAVTRAGCDTGGELDNNHCYPIIDCAAPTGCTGGTDLDVTFTCTTSFQYHSDPTDAGTTWTADTWTATLVGKDEALSGEANSSTVEMLSFLALDVTSTIAYGDLSPGGKNDPLDKITTVSATGNCALDEELSGTNMTSGANTILVEKQKYALATATAYASGTVLTVTPTEAELECSKTTVTATPATKNSWWGIEIPDPQATGTYSGTDTIGAVKDELPWP